MIKIFKNREFNLFSEIILSLFVFILTTLFIFNFFIIGRVDNFEHTYFTSNIFWLFVVIFALLVTLTIFYRKNWQIFKPIRIFFQKINNDEKYFQRTRHTLLAVLFIFCCLWVLSTQLSPIADSAAIIDITEQMAQKDFSGFRKNQYLGFFHNNIGITFFYFYFFKIFGLRNFVLLGIINALAITIIYRELSLLSEYFNFSKTVQIFTLLSGFVFLPLIFYTNLYYGNLIGLAFSLLGIRFALDAYYKKRKRKFSISISILAFFMAIFLKMNYLIFFTAFILVFLFESLRNKNKKIFFIFIPVYLTLVLFFQTPVINGLTKTVARTDISDGVSSWSFIAMGLQDNTHSVKPKSPMSRFPYMAPGWWNNYNAESFEDSNYSKKIQAKSAISNIKSSINKFDNDKNYTIHFFSRKLISQWANPSFQYAEWFIRASSQIAISDFIHYIASFNGEKHISQAMNIFILFILLGSIIFVFLSNNKNYFILILPLTFIGGFIFHIFWEVKAQYALPYFVILIPYGFVGFGLFLEKIKTPQYLIRKTYQGLKIRHILLLCITILAVILSSFMVLYGVGHNQIRLDNSEYKTFLIKQYNKRYYPIN